MQEAFEKAIRQSQSPLAREVQGTLEEQKRFEESIQLSDSLGHDFYLLTLLPHAAALVGLKREALNEKWQNLRVQFQTFSPEQQAQLVGQIATGMRISEESIDPLYKQVFGAERPWGNSDYFVTSMSLLCGHNSSQRKAFYNAMSTRLRSGSRQLPEACAAIATWLRDNTD